MLTDRKPGFYWVRVTDDWVVARWFHTSWWLAGDEIGCGDDFFEEIDETKLERVG
jgi:hypothetical protein